MTSGENLPVLRTSATSSQICSAGAFIATVTEASIGDSLSSMLPG
jgi:hypothetical protein